MAAISTTKKLVAIAVILTALIALITRMSGKSERSK